MTRDFDRPKEGFRFLPGGLKTNVVADLLPKDKYALATNVRWTLDGSVRSRPGQASKFSTGNGQPITDIGSWATLNTDNTPRYLARDIQDKIYLDNGALIGTLASASPPTKGTVFIPFRPGQSPQPWLYVSNGADYQKFSAPVVNAVTQRKVGIAEPPPSAVEETAACAAQPNVLGYFTDQTVAANYANTGTAGALADVARSADVIGVVLQETPFVLNRWILQVGAGVQYQVSQQVKLGAAGPFVVIEDVLPPMSTSANVTIQSIVYYAGTTGRCVIVLNQFPLTTQVPDFQDGTSPQARSVFLGSPLAFLRRNSLIKLSAGNEIVQIQSVTQGPDGSLAIETSTANNHTNGEIVTGIPAVVVSTATNLGAFGGAAIAATAIQSAIAAGTGNISRAATYGPTLFASPFTSSAGVFPSVPQQDDYVHLSVLVSDPTLLTSIRIMFDVGDGSFTQNYFYFDVRPGDLVSAVAGTQTQLGGVQIAQQRRTIRPVIGADQNRFALEQDVGDTLDQFDAFPGDQTSLGNTQWTEVLFPISNFTRVGNDETKTLANANAFRVAVTVTGGITFQFGGVDLRGGGQPDVGTIGSPYFYRARPRDSRTGAIGNASASTRYGVSPRRQSVIVQVPSGSYDPQIDTFDIFRYGGTVTSWRYIGSFTITGASPQFFVDNFFDDSASAGEALEFDNFEPWPSIDMPQVLTAQTLNGTVALVNISPPTNAARWLPGTKVQIGGRQVVDLRVRPRLRSGTTYLFEFVQCANIGTNATLTIQEPILANQQLPYIWGPDANGRIFGTGDPLRPGVVYFCKPYAPDTVSDEGNLEVVGPSEPLMGGEIIDGLSIVSSPERQWALYPQNSPDQPYSPVQQSQSRGFAAPYGHCNDGKHEYYWGKDGIYSSNEGSLTDADLRNLFPHEGVAGGTVAGTAYSYFGQTIQPPDYARCATFRLAIVNNYLYAIYQDSGGSYRCLTRDGRNGAWSVDFWNPFVSAIYHPPQQAGTVLSNSARYEELVMGNILGGVASEADLTNDLAGTGIVCTVAPFEWDGGDVRAPVQWGDLFVDLVPAPAGGIVVTPVSLGAQVIPPITIPTNAARQRLPLSAGGVVVSDFMGVVFQWTDNFSTQSVPSQLHVWQPSYDIQPTRDVAFFTFGTAFGMKGFIHIPELTLAYVSTQPATLTITAVDGSSPVAIVLPSSGGQYVKKYFRPTFNKARMFNFALVSSTPASFQIFEDDSEILVGEWGRSDTYKLIRGFGERTEESSPI